MKTCLVFIVLALVKNGRAQNWHDRFVLPFGHTFGDTFTTKGDDTCSAEQDLGRTIRFGNQRYDSVYVCTNGYLSFGGMNTFFSPSSFDSPSYPLLAAYLSDIQTNDNLLDYGCSVINYDDPQFDSYLIVYYTQETICGTFLDNSYPVFYQNLNSDYIADDDLRSQVEAWRLTAFNSEDLNVQFDDSITLDLMGSNTEVNLANNIFKRIVSSQSDLNFLTEITQRFTPGFVASFAYVATYYKVGAFHRRIDGFNSFQIIIVCNDAETGGVLEDDSCFSLLDFMEIGWSDNTISDSTSARAGFNDGAGNFYELPFSGTAEMRNMWALTNCDIPGLFIVKVNQKADGPSFQPITDVYHGGAEHEVHCTGDIQPKVFAMKDGQQQFSIEECIVPFFSSIQILFEISAGKRAAANVSYDRPSAILSGIAPYSFSADQHVQVFIILDGVRVLLPEKVVSFSQPADEISFQVASASSFGVSTFVFDAIPTVFSNETRLLITQLASDNSMRTDSVNFNPDASAPQIQIQNTDFEIVSFSLQDDSGPKRITANTLVATSSNTVSTGTANSKCMEWEREESRKDYSLCRSHLEKWYGCPRQLSSDRFNTGWSDAQWAHEEVLNGITGWKYDICCNHDSDLRKRLHDIGFCNKSFCEFNQGADFCIRSPRLACFEKNSMKIIYVSNQCCYESATGGLIQASDESTAPGSVDLQINSIPTMAAHFRADLQPYKHCCLQSENCQLYKTHRPTIIGNYWPRNILFGRGDPDFQTVDGQSYPFNGIGVFSLLETTLEDSTMVEASTRRVGDGSVFSGIAIQHSSDTLQLFLNKNNELLLVINNQDVNLHTFDQFSVGIFEVEAKNDARTHLKVNVQDVGLVVQVLLTGTFLNLMTSVPPSFKYKMYGLLGYYDGNTENDYTTKDGAVIDADTDYLTLHNQFGESWRVDESDWLFQSEPIKNEISADITTGSAGFQPRYDIVFDSEEDRLAAVQQCNNDTACMRDVSLTGNFSFATVFQALEESIQKADQMSELFREHEPEFAEENKAVIIFSEKLTGVVVALGCYFLLSHID